MHRSNNNILKTLITVFSVCLIIDAAIIIYFRNAITIALPVPDNLDALKCTRTCIDTNFYVCKNNWLRKSKSGLWEMYLEGNPFEIGVVNGLLTKELIYKQEKVFVDEIKKMIPSETALSLMKYGIAWYNRDIDTYFEKEQLLEIFGISKSASDEFSYIGPAYQRLLNYHAAHDIAYSFQNFVLSGCTSFTVWNSAAEDSSMIAGRNFDFYAGDEFAENKIVCFYNPDKGYKFMFVTWGGMIGAVSGMNEKGLTVTINSARSEIPFNVKTPVSILAREILQYSENINDAYKIAEKYKTSVAVTFLISSAEDKRAVIIEKAGDKTDSVTSKKDYIICTNHFQSDAFNDDKMNAEFIINSTSGYRYNRILELLEENPKLNFSEAAQILRDQKGLNNKNIGIGNEKAINQLIAHHSIIFNPEKLLVWVSANPYQLGEYVAYDLKKIFATCPGMKQDTEIYETDLSIPADTFLYSEDYKKFILYKNLRNEILNDISGDDDIDESKIETFIESNFHYYYAYELTGDYYLKHENYKKAAEYYKIALSKEIATTEEVNRIMKSLTECYENI